MAGHLTVAAVLLWSKDMQRFPVGAKDLKATISITVEDEDICSHRKSCIHRSFPSLMMEYDWGIGMFWQSRCSCTGFSTRFGNAPWPPSEIVNAGWVSAVLFSEFVFGQPFLVNQWCWPGSLRGSFRQAIQADNRLNSHRGCVLEHRCGYWCFDMALATKISCPNVWKIFDLCFGWVADWLVWSP